MESITTVLVDHDSKSGNGKKGRWVLNLFEAENGDSFQTFDRAIASEALDLLDQEVEIEYEEEQNGDFTNFVIQSITAVGEGGSKRRTSRKSSSRTNGSRSSSRSNGRSSGGSDTNKQTVINRSAALARAIESFAVASLDPVEEQAALFELANEYVAYIEGAA